MPVLTLIRTAPDFPPGSMPSYAHLVEQAVAEGAAEGLCVQKCDFFDITLGGSMRKQHLWRLRHGRRLFAETPSDLYHLLDGSMSAFLPSSLFVKTVVTVHDLIPLLQLQGRLPGTPGFFGRQVILRSIKALKQVAGLMAVSQHTRQDLSDITSRTDISVISLPVRTLETGNRSSAFDLPKRYLLHVGNNADYKNRRGVLEVFSRLQDIEDMHLVMVGPAPLLEMRQMATRLKRVHFRVNATDAELSTLYARASVFLFPSLYEGFGMPVLEAMHAGCPVVCSDAASLPEVTGKAALVASASDIEGLADQCRLVIEHPPVRDELIRNGHRQSEQFSMDRFSRSLIAWYRSVLERSVGV